MNNTDDLEFSDYARWILPGIAVGVLAFVLLANAARAQEATPQIQSLSQRLMQEINGNLQCNASLIELQQKLAKADAELAALKEPTKKQDRVPLPPEKK